ncbi:MAG: transglutaminase family protein [Polyangiaceae bacterium]
MTQLEVSVAGRWIIRHETTYRYSVPVAFAPHTLRLTPRADSVRCLERSLSISPTPFGTSEYSDTFGNSHTSVTFGASSSDELIIDSRVVVETFARPVLHSGLGLPLLPWTAPDNDALFSYRQPDGSPEVAELAHRLALQAGHAPIAFFDLVCQTLYSTLDRQIRMDGLAQTPGETIASGRGACRDLTVLFLAVCRSQGVAGRFVSGYQGQEASPDGNRHLHAWPEVFVPQLGWLGWDPAHGVVVGPGHVALSAAPDQTSTMPVDGGFYFNGPAVTSTLSYAITFARDFSVGS